MSEAIQTYLAANPITNVAQIANSLTAESTVWESLPSSLRPAKTSRELVARALADSTNVRTWNLMIDLVVQSGRFPANAASTEDFVSTGQKRAWLHLAIDRFTGKVIDERLEEVHE